MGADGVEAVMLVKVGICVELLEERDAAGWAVHHGCGDGLVEHHHWVVGCAAEQFVEG